jgi:hypothetical protein
MPSYRYDHSDRPLDGYTIEHALGRGGFGEVYYARSDSGRQVALKAVQNFEDIELRGISHCMNLKSPHLVSIFDVRHNDRGDAFVIMEYVSGPSLRELLDESPEGLGPEKAAWFVREMAKGLALLHDAGVVHRDLKPHNVFVEDGYVKVGDYSLSKTMSASHLSGHTMTVGSVHYMAPEISLGRYDKSVDIYALGVMLYEMLTGRPPFIGETMGEILMKHMSGEIDVSGIEEPFASVVLKAMAQDPGERFQSVDEMVEALFGVEHISNSVSGFNPQSLTVLAGRAARASEIAYRPTQVPRDTRKSIQEQVAIHPQTFLRAIGAWVKHWLAVATTIGRGFGVSGYPRNTFRRISSWEDRVLKGGPPVAMLALILGFIGMVTGICISLSFSSAGIVWFTACTILALFLAVQIVADYVTPVVPNAPAWFHRMLFVLPAAVVVGVNYLLFEDSIEYWNYRISGPISFLVVFPFLLLDWRWLTSSIRPSRFALLPTVLAGAVATLPALTSPGGWFPISGLICTSVVVMTQVVSPLDKLNSRTSVGASGWLRELDSVFQTRYGDSPDSPLSREQGDVAGAEAKAASVQS